MENQTTSRVEKAKQLFKSGYNCSQAVLLSFIDLIGIDEKTALKLSSSFGGGMGRMREVCGAVSGMFMVAGLLYGYDDTTDLSKKTAHYALIQEMAKQFKDKNRSIICKELLGLKEIEGSPVPEQRTDEYYKKRPCVELVGDAVEIIENYINSNK